MSNKKPKRASDGPGPSGHQPAAPSHRQSGYTNLTQYITTSSLPIQHPPAPLLGLHIASGFPSDPSQVPASKNVPPINKVAIPRLQKVTDTIKSPVSLRFTEGKHRVNHACQSCRSRKTKCTGDRPRCKHCMDFDLPCTYQDGKRDKAKKEYDQMEKRIAQYEQLFSYIAPQVGQELQTRIQRALEREPASGDEEDRLSTSRRDMRSPLTDVGGEGSISARIGSVGSIDQINEDFNRNEKVRATGYLGKTSDVAWAQRLMKKEAEGSDTVDGQQDGVDFGEDYIDMSQSGGLDPSPGQAQQEEGISKYTYHLDDMDLIDPAQVDENQVPPEDTMDFLFQTYLDSVHPSFPIIGRLNFKDQLRRFADPTRTPAMWRTILNLVFAIAAKYAHLVHLELRGDERDHLIYFTRARKLGMNSESLLAQPELQRVQIAGLMSFYLMSINQINRAWSMCGLAMRWALALGLHLRNEDSSLEDASKEMRYRVWWAICQHDRALGTLTGRPTSILDTDCTTPLPCPVEEYDMFDNALQAVPNALIHFPRYASHDFLTALGSLSPPQSSASTSSSATPESSLSAILDAKDMPANSALFFLYSVQLNLLGHDAVSTIYRAGGRSKSWFDVQSLIGMHDARLERWKSELNPWFDFTNPTNQSEVYRHRIILGFYYYSAKVIVNRPCLCRLARAIPNESNKSRDFNGEAAAKCVRAARDLLDLIPDQSNSAWLFKVSPWWCLTHYLMQAATILILELYFRAEHVPGDLQEVFCSAKKAIRWLHAMSADSMAASRAWNLAYQMLRKIAPRIGGNVDDLPSRTQNSRFSSGPIPSPGWPDLSTRTNLFPNQHYFAETGTAHFQPSIYTSYDDFIPVSATLPPQLDELYSQTHLDRITNGFVPETVRNPLYGQHQGWEPMVEDEDYDAP